MFLEKVIRNNEENEKETLRTASICFTFSIVVDFFADEVELHSFWASIAIVRMNAKKTLITTPEKKRNLP